MYKIIYCGTPDISVEILKGLEKLNLNIVGVITQPDKAIGRKREVIFSPIKQYCLLKGYKIFQPNKILTILDELKKLNPDFLVTCAYGQFIPQNILDLFKNAINVHASLLPKYRGGSPIQFALINGEKKTGISLMKMIKKMDAGEIYFQDEIEIFDEDDSGTLFNKLAIFGRKAVEKYLINIFEKKILGSSQNEEKVTFAYNLSSDQEKIDWSKSAYEINNFIRALSPSPVAFSFLEKERIKIKKTRLISVDEKITTLDKIFEPGEIIFLDNEGIVVYTKNGLLKILELQREGKKMVRAGTFNGQNSIVKVGSKFR
ncbi:methionyl-tRNA formyltransferase [Spiroplasma taiwanense CT-1]|uniref:Methionyl-tRNA formyltransferase n=2 Tax=Spiroplasma taiwanense TaxID=2145 RepID=S5LTG9_9MOLU|nr:methionyl-tRNA formyltransferase [Spiroplasma taiwanense CT-1]